MTKHIWTCTPAPILTHAHSVVEPAPNSKPAPFNVDDLVMVRRDFDGAAYDNQARIVSRRENGTYNVSYVDGHTPSELGVTVDRMIPSSAAAPNTAFHTAFPALPGQRNTRLSGGCGSERSLPTI